jgi:O-antigen/teichoic acid export membrane protein
MNRNDLARFFKGIFTINRFTNTHGSQGKKRIKRAFVTGITTVLVKGITVSAGLISIPLTSHYLGVERFGLWLTLSSLLTWISVADLGLANSLTNVLAVSDEKTEKKRAREAVASAFYLMVGIAFLITLCFLILYPFISWAGVFNVTSAQARSEAGPAIIAGMLYFALRLPLSIPGRIYAAYQEGYYYQLWSGLSSIISVIGLIVSIQLRTDIPWMVSAFFGSLLIGDFISAIHIFIYYKPWLMPRIKNWKLLQAKYLLKVGFLFWIVQISAIVFLQTDLIIVAQLFGANEVATYGVTLRLFSLIGIIQAAFIMPLWPAYSEAQSRKDIDWIIRTFKNSLWVSLAWSMISGICLLGFSPLIISNWVSPSAVPSYSLLLAMFLTAILTACGQCISMLMNGLGEIKSQVIISSSAGLANLILSIVLGHLIGSSGVAWATGICVLIFSLILIGSNALNKLKLLKMEVA